MSELFRMKVVDLFAAGGKTIFVGSVETAAKYIGLTTCKVVIDGATTEEIEVSGEVIGTGGHRDLWTRSPLRLSRETVRMRDVWLIAS